MQNSNRSSLASPKQEDGILQGTTRWQMEGGKLEAVPLPLSESKGSFWVPTLN